MPTRCPHQDLLKQADGTEFQSICSLDKLCPDSRGSDTVWRVLDAASQTNNDIPLDRLTVSYCQSSSPGGQNVNKVNAKAEVRFLLATADWMQSHGQKMAIMHKNKINRLGELILTSECSCSQLRNLADCLQKTRDMVAEASQVPMEPSKEDAVLRRIRIGNMNWERLRKRE
ncbi:PREDICTED: peptidyl-tRNA hydrolase ICT1, mitochondrial-like [Miniopterus natalensis]|uniref:peptidyl-tRNA hydrolase ICT1, mitochondrial-like n=1 Tax=Miniopterus natalensis TaxID=291302 RepID=UPI0007A6CCF4|nr:PREDICTED: peptidyl-tRNA hydrolase ICT1, mitochondrial-like [Miniopterus natalensis]